MDVEKKQFFIYTNSKIAWKRKHCPRGRRSLQRDSARITSEMCAKGILMSNIETDMDGR